jgi:4-oxalocrotonate tautomerase
MPFVEINAIKGVFTQAQKEEMIKKVTDAMVSVEGEKMRSVTWVVIREIESGDWAIGGKILHTDEVKALSANF